MDDYETNKKKHGLVALVGLECVGLAQPELKKDLSDEVAQTQGLGLNNSS